MKKGEFPMERNTKREIYSHLISIATTLLFLVVTTWFWFGPRIELSEAQSVMKGQEFINLQFIDLSEGIQLENAYPVTDQKGSSIDPYRFQIINHDQKEVTFTIGFVNDLLAIEKDHCKPLDNNYIRYTIKKNEEAFTDPRNLALDGSMYQETLQPGESATYSLKFWIDQNAGNEIMNTHFHGKVAIIQKAS